MDDRDARQEEGWQGFCRLVKDRGGRVHAGILIREGNTTVAELDPSFYKWTVELELADGADHLELRINHWPGGPDEIEIPDFLDAYERELEADHVEQKAIAEEKRQEVIDIVRDAFGADVSILANMTHVETHPDGTTSMTTVGNSQEEIEAYVQELKDRTAEEGER
jgi:hypothetical protein